MDATRAQTDAETRLAFMNRLQAVANRIHSAADIDEIMLDASDDIRELFDCDRLTIYAVNADRTRIRSRIKTGMQQFKDFSLPITGGSVAGYCALSKKPINLRDAYDEAELRAHSPDLAFLDKMDRRTGYVTKQMLTAPIVNAANGELLGVAQFINHRPGGPFPPLLEEGARELCKTLAIAFAQRMKAEIPIRSKYDPLVADGVLSQAELALAARAARRKGVDVESVLTDEFQIRLEDIGKTLAAFFGVPYEPFRAEREKPAEALKQLKREYVENQRWLPLKEKEGALAILTTDPEGVTASRVVNQLFPGKALAWRVTTNREFALTVDQFFGPAQRVPEENARAAGRSAVTKQELLEQAHLLIAGALRTLDGSAVDVTMRPPEEIVASEAADGTLYSVRGRIVIDFRIGAPAR